MSDRLVVPEVFPIPEGSIIVLRGFESDDFEEMHDAVIHALAGAIPHTAWVVVNVAPNQNIELVEPDVLAAVLTELGWTVTRP